MRVVSVSTIKQSYDLIPNALAGDELTLYSAGDVIAGVDLSLLKTEDVHREPDGTIVVRLPPPQLLVSRIDNRATHVIDRRTGVFRRADVGMEGRARQYAEQNIRNEALHKGILPLAQQERRSAHRGIAAHAQRVCSHTIAPEGQVMAGFEKERDRLDAQMNNRGNAARVSDATGTAGAPPVRQVSNR